VLFALTILSAAATGAYRVAPMEALTLLAKAVGIDLGVPVTAQQEAVFYAIRLPRILLAVLAGAALAVSGAALQGLFRNPLADPGVIGVSAGAALAVAAVIVMGSTVAAGLHRALGLWTLPVVGFCGALAVTACVYGLAERQGVTAITTLLLAGIAINALAFAGIGFASFIATDEQLRNLTFWSFGSLGGGTWAVLGVLTLPLIAVLLLMLRLAPALDALLLGEAEAQHLGFDVASVKRWVFAGAALAAGFVVAFCGMIGFVALVAPHLMRLLVGPAHRYVIPGSALIGASLMLAADSVARRVVTPAELPIGIVTALLGTPFFLALLLRQRASPSSW
jgi:iron complex transport system permease protein